MDILTPRLILRPWKEEDAPALFRYASDPEVGPRAGWNPHRSLGESLFVIRELFSDDRTWAVELREETSGPVGCIGFLTSGHGNIPLGPEDVEVGYWVARPYWNRGICTEALGAVVDHCLRTVGYRTVWGDCFLENAASRRVMEKCGFLDTGKVEFLLTPGGGYGMPVRVMRLDRDLAEGEV